MICDKCNVELDLLPVKLKYLGREFQEKLPCCPKCGMVYISEELATGKMAQLEEELEEK